MYHWPMSTQIVLSWDIDPRGSAFGQATAASLLGNVVLYQSTTNDPVLGQLLGLTVDSDVTAVVGLLARRTLTLNMDLQNDPKAPPLFPCHPRTALPPAPPYPLRAQVSLADGQTCLSVATGSAIVKTSIPLVASLRVGDPIQFLSQIGKFYEVQAITTTQITLTGSYTGKAGPTSAFKEIPAPVTRAALFSSSDFDSAAIATVVPALPNGPGAQTIELTYKDSLGNGPFNVEVSLTGKRPAAVVLDGGSVDIAEIVSMTVDDTGTFANSIGHIVLCELSDPLPEIPNGTPRGTPDNFNQGRTLVTLTSEAQMLITRHLVYLPPSYFAVAAHQRLFSGAPPSDTELAGPLAQFVDPQTAAPPPGPPFPPSTVPTPTFLSGYFTRTIQLALAGVKITPRAITFL